MVSVVTPSVGASLVKSERIGLDTVLTYSSMVPSACKID